MKIERSFDYIDGKHVPTIKIFLEPCLVDDMEAWDQRDELAKIVEKMLCEALIGERND